MKLHLQFARLAALAVLGCVGACSSQGVGRSCISAAGGGYSDAGVPTVSIATPALECPSRICYVQQPTPTIPARGVCTATCEDNGDCGNSIRGTGQEGLCSRDFVCAVATETGPFGCRKLCVCRDDLIRDFNVNGSGQIITPGACTARTTNTNP